MKILILITRGDSIGGAQTHVIDIASVYIEKGHEVLVCYGGELSGPFYDLLSEAKIPSVNISVLKREISPLNDFKSIIKIKKVINNYQPDILCLHSSKAGIVGRICGKIARVPVVLTVHGWSFTEGVGRKQAILYKFLEKSLARFVDRFILVSNFDKRIALKHRIAKESKLMVVHNGIKINDFSKLKQAKQVLDLVMVARFDEQKDHFTLINALIGLENFKLHLLGDGPNLETTKKLVMDLGLSKEVIFYGYSNNVKDVLAKSDLFLLISNWEGFPISTLEAMNYELPVIVSGVGGAAEAVISGETGFITPRNDIDQLSRILAKLLDDHEQLYQMGKLGKIKLRESFSINAMYEKVSKVYEEVLVEKSS